MQKNYNLYNLKRKLLSKEIDSEFKYTLRKNEQYLKRIFPPQIIEIERNITGVATYWKMPLGLGHMDIENILEIFHDEEIYKFILNELIKLNPKLKIFSNYTFISQNFGCPIGGVIGGVCSSININDIKDYIDYYPEIIELPKLENNFKYKFNRKGKYDKNYSDIYTEIYHNCGDNPLQWFPSIDTMNFILSKIKK